MYVVGLMGQIGSGKSTAGQFFSEYGAAVIDTDHLAREVISNDAAVYRHIVTYFGQTVVTSDGTLNRHVLRQCIFADSEQRLWLEQLLHPRIEHLLLKQIAQQNNPYCVVLLPLLIDRQRFAYIQRILAIDCDISTQQQRVLARDAIDQNLFQQILATQATQLQLTQLADDWLHNTGDLEALRHQVLKHHRRYILAAAKG